MNSLQLMNDYPKSTVVIKEWVVNKLLDSLKDTSLPDDFKEFVKAQDVEDDKIAAIIDTNPRLLFDLFDKHKLYIETIVDTDGGFWWKIGENQSEIGYEYRINHDVAAINEAFKLLEDKL